MVYSSPSSLSSDEKEELGEEFCKRQILMFLDALVFTDASENEDQVVLEPRHSEAQEQECRNSGRSRQWAVGP
jgi:hypothetical protein